MIKGIPCTCCGDVERLLSYDKEGRSFCLCKTSVLKDTDRSESGHWVFMLIVKDDEYPIIITEECAKSILKNSEKGATLVYNRWFDRYK